jgi:hypothetical protein
LFVCQFLLAFRKDIYFSGHNTINRPTRN